MVESPYASWNSLALNIAFGCWALGLLVIVGYIVRLSSVPDNKDKYDFINRHEVKVLWYASLILIVGACAYFNSNIVELTTIMTFVRVFLTAMMGTIAALIIQNLLKFYYPFFIEKRLKVLRHTSSISRSQKHFQPWNYLIQYHFFDVIDGVQDSVSGVKN